MVWKNQSRKLGALIRWVLGSETFKNAKMQKCKKKKKKLLALFFFNFRAAIMDL